MIRIVAESVPDTRCCEHCQEIPLLRQELAELQTIVAQLTTGVAPDPAGETVAVVEPVQEALIPRPVPGGPGLLPQVDRMSTEQAKLGLFRTLFAGREDVFAYRWENMREGKKGWAPKRRPGSRREDNDFLPLTDAVVAEHLIDTPATYGLYVMLPDSTCRVLVCDFDDAAWRLDARAYAEAAHAAGVPAAVEVSRSGEGAHVWIFFSEPVPAADARAFGAALLREAMAIRGELGLDSYDRFFPSQDFIPKTGLGNLIALPLQGKARRGGTSLFVDTGSFEPYEDQFAFLSQVGRLSRRQVAELVEELQPPAVGPAARLYRSPLGGEPPPPEVTKGEFGGMLAIRRAGLPPGLLASLKHLAALHNPEFYERQRLGFSVWDTPSMIRCYDETLEHLYLPRGISARAVELIEKAGSRLDVVDVRPEPEPLQVSFTGTLRDTVQEQAVEAMSGHQLGVLVAPPGSGKTVMACALIARHQTPTLVLVDRGPLLTQWRKRLAQHLNLHSKQIGQLGGGKNKLTGEVDLATLQTLTRLEDPAQVLSQYGLIVVDECHHVAAHTFASAIKNVPARRWLGLTATPKRTDRREEIMFMHCGPVRHRIHTTGDLIQTLHVHPTEATVRDDIDIDTPGLLQSIIMPALVADPARTGQIAEDVHHAHQRGRNSLVLASRTEHVNAIATAITGRGLAPLVLHGSLTPKQRRSIIDYLETWDAAAEQRPLLLVATGSYIGEGFDCPALDTLFLCSPLSSEPLLTQYIGRIVRAHPGKTSVEVHDYADTRIGMLSRMHGKRLTAYRRLGFAPHADVLSPSPVPPRRRPAGPPAKTATPEAAAPPTTTAGPKPADVRAWAKQHGLHIADRGRIRPEVWEQYNAAHS